MQDLVMRSVYLPPGEDAELRQLAHELDVTKSDLIRSAISVKLHEWRHAVDDRQVRHDLTFGQRDRGADRADAGTAGDMPRANAPVKPPARRTGKAAPHGAPGRKRRAEPAVRHAVANLGEKVMD